MQTIFVENTRIGLFPCIRRPGVSLTALIADPRKAVAGDAVRIRVTVSGPESAGRCRELAAAMDGRCPRH
jgi:hypothetical protein